MDLPAYISAAGLLLAGVAAVAQARRSWRQRNDDHDELVRFLERQLSECEEREKRSRRRRTPDE